MHFDFWKIDIQPTWSPKDVWVRVYDLPPLALDDFLAIWAIGDIFGKTKDLDIVFTMANKVLCILVICLDPTLIPNTWDLKIKNDFFRLHFEVEGLQLPTSTDVTMSDPPKQDDDFGDSGNGQNGNASNRESKRSKSTSPAENNEGNRNTTSAQNTGTMIAKSPSNSV
jgi:hypothetical protein